jgi:DNA-binding response OmpR family regulator
MTALLLAFQVVTGTTLYFDHDAASALDTERYELCVDGVSDETCTPISVLKVLARHARQPLSREMLMELARGREYEVFDRSLDVQISRLRKLIEPDPSAPRFIQTVWGLGYVFIPDGVKA